MTTGPVTTGLVTIRAGAMVLALAVLGLGWGAGVAWAGEEAVPLHWRYGWPKTDFSRAVAPFGDFLDGGVGKDGIPPIYAPEFRAASQVEGLGANEPVITVSLGGEVRAYPVRILMWHEIANDVIGTIPIAVTYCPLCNTAVVFDRRVGGRVLKFGVSGLLRHSDLIMWNHGDGEDDGEGWWQQFTGECLVGWCVGERLKIYAGRLESWGAFAARAPDAMVLVPPRAYRDQRSYGVNPYAEYDSAPQPFLYRGDLPGDIEPMARVVSLGERGAVSLALLRRLERIRLGDGVELLWSAGQNSALDTRDIRAGRDVGSVRVVRGGVDIRHEVPFAFVQYAFHPDAPIVVREENLDALASR